MYQIINQTTSGKAVISEKEQAPDKISPSVPPTLFFLEDRRLTWNKQFSISLQVI